MNRLLNLFTMENSEEGSSNSNSSSKLHCEPGIFLPPWMPQDDVSAGQIVGRGIVYVLSLAYIFVGIGFLTHKFMASILMVTSKRKEVKVRDEHGNMQTVVVQIWNQTVAAITLMAMGCSMPEVLLTIIEVVGHNFETGELGPCSTVGSAVFNMCFVIAVCNFVIPKGENRRIKRLGVHLVMSVWSAFAYVWLYLIVIVISPGEIEVWESVLTLVFFPLMVVSAYIADKSTQKMSKTYRMGSNNILIETTSDSVSDQLHLKQFPEELESKEMHQFEDKRRRFLAHLQTIRRTHPEFDADELELMAATELFEKGTISRAFHRMTVATKLTGLKSIQIRQKSQRNELLNLTRPPVVSSQSQSQHVTQVSFNPGNYTVSETTNKLRATVTRENGNLMRHLLVDYETDDGGAVASENYVATKGTICFQPGETKQEIQIEMLDNFLHEGNYHFYIRLSNARFTSVEDHLSVPLIGNNTTNNSTQTYDNLAFSTGESLVNMEYKNSSVILANPSIATVMILDDKHHGIFSLFESEVSIKETAGYYNFQVIRRGGSRGCVSLKYRTESGTAKPGRDYRHCEGELLFEDGDVEKGVSVPIFVKNVYEKNVVFFFTLQEPELITEGEKESEIKSDVIPTISLKTEKMRTAFDRRPQLGQVHKTLVRIHESTSFKNLVDKIMKKSKVSANRGMDAWKQQIIGALHIDESHGHDIEDDQQPIKKTHTWTDYLEYAITFFWRLVWAIFLPPEIIGGGYPCLLLCIGFIGFIITIVFDLASALGCTVGLADAVTAVAFIAIGTCLPDLFASKIACVRDEHADDSIINVTGANAINVYLGVGVAWFMAVIKKTVDGEVLQVKGGELLGFVLSIYVGVAVFTTILLLIRRLKTVSGGELGGPLKYKVPTSILLSTLWISFVIVTALEAYGYIHA